MSANEEPDNQKANSHGAEEPQIFAVQQRGTRWGIARRNVVAGSAVAAASALLGCSTEPPLGPEPPPVGPSPPAPPVPIEPFAHKDNVNVMKSDPSGSLLITGGQDHTVKLWSLPSGDLRKTLLGHNAAVYQIAFSPNGRQMATADRNGTMIVWLLPEGVQHYRYDKTNTALDDLCVTNLGQVVTQHQRNLEIFDPPTTQTPRTITLEYTPNLHAFADNSREIWSVSSIAPQTIGITSVAEGKRKHTIDNISCSSLAVSPNGMMFAAVCSDQTLRLFSLPEGKPLDSMPLEANVASIRFRDDTTIETMREKDHATNEARFYRVTPGWALMRYIRAHSASILDFALSENRQYAATVSKDRSVKVWKVADWSLFRTLDPLPAACFAVAFHKDKRHLLLGGGDGNLHIWPVNEPESGITQILPGHQGGITQIAVAGVNIWTVGRDDQVKGWATEANELRLLNSFSGNSSKVYSLAVSDLQLATGSLEGDIRLWTHQGVLRRQLSEQIGTVFTLAVSRFGTLIVSGGADGAVRLWNAASGRVTKTFAGHTGDVYSVAMEETRNLLASCGKDGTVRIWNVASGVELQTIETNTPQLDVRFLSDTEIAATGEDGHIRVWNLPRVAELGREQITVNREVTVNGGISVFVEKHEIVVVARQKSISIQSAKTGEQKAVVKDQVAMNEVETQRREETARVVAEAQKRHADEMKSKAEAKARAATTTYSAPAYSPPSYSPPSYSYGGHYWRPN